MLTDDQAKVAISENLNRILEEQDKSAYWLMTHLGMSSGALYPIIRGKSLPSVALAARIAELLEVSVDDLIQEVEKEIPKKVSRGRKTA